MSIRYGHEKVKRSLIHFVLGKGVSALAGFAVLLLIVRELSVIEFGTYSVLIGLVEIFTTVSGFGLAHALLRYVPELYSLNFQKSLKQFVFFAISLRSAILIFVGIIAYYFSPDLARLIGLENMRDALEAFLLVAVLRSSAHFVSQVLESTLHQGIVQLGFFTATIVRLIGVMYLISIGPLQLADVILVEALGDALSLIIMVAGVMKVLKDKRNQNAQDNGNWLSVNLKQVAKFALSGYAQHIAITPYGGNTNRLVGGHMLPIPVMAGYGFAHSIYEYIKRYMPAQLLIGIIRPLVIARYSEQKEFSLASDICNQVMQVNIILILFAFSILTIGGEQILLVVSAGKYGVDTMFILLALFAVLLLESRRQQLELLVQVVEKYHFLIYSNILLAASVLLAIAFVPQFGAIAFPIANAVGLLVANEWVRKQLKNAEFFYNHTWLASIKVIAICAIAVLVGGILKSVNVSWLLAVVSTSVAYIFLTYIFCKNDLVHFANNLTGKVYEMPNLQEEPNTKIKAVKIAFGVLSSKQCASTVDHIAQLVYPHPVYVHHDFTKEPNFSPKEENIILLENTVATGWGNWSLVEASYLLMQQAMKDPEITHFQLMSESDLLVRPIREFEDYLIKEKPDVMIDILPMTDEKTIFSHGWRYLSKNLFVTKVLSKATSMLTEGGYSHVQGINLRLVKPPRGAKQKFLHLIARFVLWISALSNKAMLGRLGLSHIAIGGQWFGTNRRTAQWLLRIRNQFVTLTKYYQHVHIPDESFFHTLISNAHRLGIITKIYPSNHLLFWEGCNSGPDTVAMVDIDKIKNSNKFICRKFDLSIDNEARKHFVDKGNSER